RTPSRSASTSTGAGAGTEAAADRGEEASVRSCGGRGGALIAGPGRSAEPSLAGLYKYSRPRGLDVAAGCLARSGVVVPVVVRSVPVVLGMVDLVEVVRAELVQQVVDESARELVAHHPPGARGVHPARLAQEGEGMRGRGLVRVDRAGEVGAAHSRMGVEAEEEPESARIGEQGHAGRELVEAVLLGEELA